MNQIIKNEIEKFGALPEWGKLNDKDFNKLGYEIAIKRATIDMTPRTLSPKDKTKKPALCEAFLNLPDTEIEGYVGKESLLNVIEKYFSDNPKGSSESFDEWHKTTCSNIILPAIRHFYTNRDTEQTPVCYGKAQKILNIALKCCYCLKGARDKEDYFKYCHVPLDRFTLNWYKANGGKITTEWSKLEFKDYKEIQDFIREKDFRDIDQFDGLTPLQKEFMVWRLEIMKSSVMTINQCLGGIIDEDYATEYCKKHNVENDLKMAKVILGKTKINEIEDDNDFISWLKKIRINQKNRPSADFILSQLSKYAETEDT